MNPRDSRNKRETHKHAGNGLQKLLPRTATPVLRYLHQRSEHSTVEDRVQLRL